MAQHFGRRHNDGCGDGLFGPGISSVCRGGFDFTFLFEDSILNLLPAAGFALLAPLRIWQLAGRQDMVKRSRAVILALVASETAVLAFASVTRDKPSPIALPAAAVSLVASVELVALSHFEHCKSIRPSLLVCSFLAVTILLDVARVRSAWLQFHNTGWAACLVASLASKVIAFASESWEKRRWLLGESPSKESTSSPLGQALFLWLNELLVMGWQAVLKPGMLPAVDEKLDLENVHRKLQTSWLSVNHKRRNALILAMFQAFKFDILIVVAPRLCLIGLSLAQPFIIGQTVTFLEGESTASTNIGYGLLGAFVLVFIGIAISTALYQHLGYRVVTMLRGGLIMALYDQLLRLPNESATESSAMALMGTDAESFADYFHAAITDIWADVLQVSLAIYLLAHIVGAICIAPIVIAILFTWLSFRVGHMIAGRQRRWLDFTQKRVNFTTEVLGRIRDIRALGLIELFARDISDLRSQELNRSKAYRSVQSIKICLVQFSVNFPMILGQFAVFVAYGISAHVHGTAGLSVAETVTALSLINILLTPLRNLLHSIPDTFSAVTCLWRIQEFLLKVPREEKRLLPDHTVNKIMEIPRSKSISNKQLPQNDLELSQMTGPQGDESSFPAHSTAPAISMIDAAFGWDTTPIKTDVQDSPGTELVAFETPASGSLTFIVGPVGCGKSTLLKGVLGETSFLRGKVSLNTAEVAYCAQEPWIVNGSIFDNIVGMSNEHLDPNWYSAVTQACALDIDFSLLQRGDRTTVGDKGIKLSGGQKQRIALARAVYSRKSLVLLDDVLSGLDNTTRSNVFNRVCGPTGLLRQAGRTLVMTAAHPYGGQLAAADHVIVLGLGGKIQQQGTFQHLSQMNGPLAHIEYAEDSNSSETNGGGPESMDIIDGTSSNVGEEPEVESLRNPDWTVWKYYFSTMGWGNIALLCFFISIESGFGAFRYVWLTWWSASPDAASASHLGYWIGLYAAFAVLEASGLLVAIFWNWVVMVPAASARFHVAVLAATVGASTAFLAGGGTTGQLVNRFSGDMRLVDMMLPPSFIGVAFQLLATTAQAAVVIAAQPYLAPAIPFAAAALVLVQRFYLRTSRQLRLLEIEMKAPVFSHFIESLHGLVTIRAFGWEAAYRDRARGLLGVAQKPYYLLLSVQRWLVLVLNLVVAGVTILLVGLGIALRDRVNPGTMGVALVMMTSLTQLIAELIQAWTLLETSLGAITRIKSFSENTPQEATSSAPGVVVGEQWPPSGSINFQSTCAKHESSGVSVLRDINLSILPGQRVGICGRTGSGKSSLIMSLLRMLEIDAGRITIDGVDIAGVLPSLLRTRLTCVTQDPFIFPASVRRNIDPTGTSSDDDIIAALNTVGLWAVINERAKMNGSEADPLSVEMDQTFLSHGQGQLFSMSRALLRKSSILLLDEPTSRLDSETHDRVQAAIRSCFDSCTILMVAHRVESLLDLDYVAVMDGGKLVEYGAPASLLSDSDSAFARLYRSGE
ncbi:putative ABC transporter [Xylariales sp. PMI_506]|nr:putative ABC transporter [Xylariales sp. PMI_506]